LEDGIDRELVSKEQLAQDSEIVIALGGDGTILRAANLVRDSSTPILGVNLGRLGFLADSAPEQLEDAIEQVTPGEVSD